MTRRRRSSKREVSFTSFDAEDGGSLLDRAEAKAAEIDPTFAEQAERWKPGRESDEGSPERGSYDWISTEATIFHDVPVEERRVCTEWLRRAKQRDIARRCKIPQRTVRRIISDFKVHLRELAAKGQITQEDLEEYVALLGGNTTATIARIKQSPPRKDQPHTVLDPTRNVAVKVADELPDEVYAERLARQKAIVERLERDRHGRSSIGLPPLAHRRKYRRRRKPR
jgi:hypothetical protein